MPAKKTAAKPVKGKKAASRPAARKAAIRKPTERAKTSVHARSPVAAALTRKPTPGPRSTPTTAEPVETMRRRAAERTVAPPGKKPAAPPSPLPPRTAAPTPPAAIDGDESDALEPGSLLAGPRNVQPYIVKRGEQYMSKEQSEHFRQILQTWKRDLMEEVDRTVTHMKDEAANFPDPNDRATQEEEFSLELRTRDRERKLIRKIDEALKRIEDGSYGYCLETGEEIGIKRLEARPVATLSIEAQERRERRERQYGDRDDRYR
ncbi:MAG TPA: RNA polymerase-binding protein DksA [Steroidobacteraceae bacterium]|nr:RNA polymerase-binding protein DksA [Steroidobacteraceae bacterium]